MRGAIDLVGENALAGEAVEGYFRKVARHAALAALEKKGRTPSALSGEVLETLDQAWARPAGGDSLKSETLQRCSVQSSSAPAVSRVISAFSLAPLVPLR